MAHIADVVARHGLLDRSLEAIQGALAQALDLGAGGAHVEGPRVVPHPAVDDGAGVDGDHVAVAQDDVGIGNAVDHGVVQRRADGAGETAVTLKGGGAAMHADDLLGELVELERRYARANHGTNVAERHLGQRSGLLHLLDLGRRLDLNHRPSSAFTSPYTTSMSRLPSTTLRIP